MSHRHSVKASHLPNGGVVTLRDPKNIAASLKRCVDAARSTRRKVLARAKDELKEQFHRD